MRAAWKNRKAKAAVVVFALLLAAAGAYIGTTGVSSQRPTRAAASLGAASKIAPDVAAELTNGGTAPVIVFMADQADVSAAYAIKDLDQRGWFVYKTLTDHANRAQADLRKLLDQESRKYQAFWGANMIALDADEKLVQALAERSDVARIDSNRPIYGIERPVVANKADATVKNAPTAAEWGVTNVNAPSVWTMGFAGQGIVIGNLDTGTRWTHAALKPHYRGWNGTTADHNYNWHDAIHTGGGACGANTIAPCDDNGHGTHTAGSIVGDDGAGNQIGVAPNARWIGCRNMDQGNGTPATYTECFQFMIAPTDSAGNNANPALRPHILNNSWGCPTSEGCTTRAELATIVSNTQAAGIFVTVSAGNSGSACSTVSDPPAIYNEAFAVGAISITNALASFSSRGPSTFYSPSILKPAISAPGVSIRSSYFSSDTTYTSLSGTSMAGPHVAGVVALLWSARPQLMRDIAATKAVLQNTANPGVTVATPQTCGGTPSTAIPNNSFGYGRVDALAAVNSVAGTTAAGVSVSGRVLTRTGTGVRGVTVTIRDANGATRTAITNAFGYYSFDSVPAGSTYSLQASAARMRFPVRALLVNDTLTDADLVEEQ